MTDNLLKIYHRLPYPVRSLVASCRGLYLCAWRYGQVTEQLVEEALERESWDAARWEDWQQEQLAVLLHRAATRVPYYSKQWEERRRRGDKRSYGYLENWPILEKETLRQNALAFIADDCHPRHMFHDHTSGTTGKPLNLWGSKKTVRAWYALFEARARQWYGVSRFDRWAILGGQLVVPGLQKSPPFWVWNAGMKQLYMSSYHLSPKLIPAYVDALLHYRIKYLLGYTSALYALAQQVLMANRRDLKMEVVITNAEPLFEYQRRTISEAFQCPVRETYGMAETVMAASECQAGALHLWPDVGITEIVEGEESLADGQTGDFICTGLLNADMPLIRYRVGDRGSLSRQAASCLCGRLLPLVNKIEGRIDDLLYTRDGRRIGRMDPIFKSNLPIREAQIIQERLDKIRVLYIPTPEFTSAAGRSIIERVQARMGDVEVLLNEVEEIPRTANGKFRAVICQLSSKDQVVKP